METGRVPSHRVARLDCRDHGGGRLWGRPGQTIVFRCLPNLREPSDDAKRSSVNGVDPEALRFNPYVKSHGVPEQSDTVQPLADVVFISAPHTSHSEGTNRISGKCNESAPPFAIN